MRLYRVIAVNDRTGQRYDLTAPAQPVTHAEGCTIMRKQAPSKHGRVMLEEVTDPADERCAECRRPEHAACSMLNYCPCCRRTAEQGA